MPDAQAEDEPVQGDGPPRLYAGGQVCDTGLAIAVRGLELFELFSIPGQTEDVGRLADPAPFEKGGQLLFPKALDVIGPAGDEMAQVLDPLERTGELAGTPTHHGLCPASCGLAHQRGFQ